VERVEPRGLTRREMPHATVEPAPPRYAARPEVHDERPVHRKVRCLVACHVAGRGTPPADGSPGEVQGLLRDNSGMTERCWLRRHAAGEGFGGDREPQPRRGRRPWWVNLN